MQTKACVGGGGGGGAGIWEINFKSTPLMCFSLKRFGRQSHQVNSKQKGPDPAAVSCGGAGAVSLPRCPRQGAAHVSPAPLPTPKGRSIFETTEAYNGMETLFSESAGSAQQPRNTTFVASCAAV